MKRSIILLSFIGSIILIGVGAFYVGHVLGTGPAATLATPPTEILEQAKSVVPPPVFPPKPAGREIVENVAQQTQIDVPITTMVPTGPFRVPVPQVKIEKRTVTQSVPKRTLVDASPEQIAAWNAEVKKVQDEYQQKLIAEAARITQKEKQKNTEEIIATTSALIRETITPLVLALGGLVGAVVALLKALGYGVAAPQRAGTSPRQPDPVGT